MTNVWVVRAEFGKYADDFINGGYVAIGWLRENDLTEVVDREEVRQLYADSHPDTTSSLVIGQQTGQISRFLFEIQPKDFVITPSSDTEFLHYGEVLPDPPYYYAPGADHCPFPQRKKVRWSSKKLRRADFSVPFQNTIRSSLTVFKVSQGEEFLQVIGKEGRISPRVPETYDPYKAVLNRILELTATEFEILTRDLLKAMGFEETEAVGCTGDGGVDVRGVLDVGNLAKIRLFVQAKRYKLGATISANTVRQLRQAIPNGSQGAFITTADFQNKAHDIATEVGFPRIGLINGPKLVDLLVEHWNDLPVELREQLGLTPGLVLK